MKIIFITAVLLAPPLAAQTVYPFTLSSSLDEEASMHELAREVVARLKVLQTMPAAMREKKIGWSVEAAVVDRYGQESKRRVFWLWFETKDISKINFNNMNEYRIMEFATPVSLNKAGTDCLAAWAMNDRVIKHCPTFARKVAFGT